MKIKRSLLAVAITLAAAACSGDVTSSDPALRASQSAAPGETTTTSTPAPAVTDPEEDDDGTGAVGSGCCANR